MNFFSARTWLVRRLLAALTLGVLGGQFAVVFAADARQQWAPPPSPVDAPYEAMDVPWDIDHGPPMSYPLQAPLGPADCAEPWRLQAMPDGLIYRSYMAGVKEPGFRSVWSSDSQVGSVWDISLGGRIGLLRYGTTDDYQPDGWQIDLEGAVFPRLSPSDYSTPLISADFRAGIPVTYGAGPLHMKFAYYHLSSHLGDEFMLANPGVERINYSRDCLVWGVGYYWSDALRVYGEIGFALSAVGGAEPWETQCGVDYSRRCTTAAGSPFAAFNAHLREDVNFNGHVVIQAGWQWRNGDNGRRTRLGVQYYDGKNEQYEFLRTSESKIGGGIWFDF